MELEETIHPDGHEISVVHNDGNSRTTVRRSSREECLTDLVVSGLLPVPDAEPEPEPAPEPEPEPQPEPEPAPEQS